jgi:uncharacterized protein YcaQ
MKSKSNAPVAPSHAPAYALTGLSPNPDDWPEPPGRIRVLSPFDPVLRDRNRAERLFGFRYRIEVFVPEAKAGIWLLRLPAA